MDALVWNKTIAQIDEVEKLTMTELLANLIAYGWSTDVRISHTDVE
jgi:hypothetical protein